MQKKPRYYVTEIEGGWLVVDSEHRDVFHATRSKEGADRLAREWNDYNGPPVTGLAGMLSIDPKRRRR